MMMSICSICDKPIYPGERTKADQNGTLVHMRCWHYEIASIVCESCGCALTDDEFEQAAYVPEALLWCNQCYEDD